MYYPENAIKGIPNRDFLLEDGLLPSSHLFHFKPENARDDGWIEQSINWEDDESVLEFTLRQTKENDEIQFKAGAAIIPRHELDRLNNRPTIRGLLSYERQPLDHNPYHGNLLLKVHVSKQAMKMIAAAIALTVSKIESRTETMNQKNKIE
jgi:hypothetical protein